MSVYHERELAKLGSPANLREALEEQYRIKITSDHGETRWLSIPYSALVHIKNVLVRLED